MKISESQNHKMVGVGRDLCGSSSPTLLPKQGHLQQAAQDRIQAGLEYLWRRRLHNFPGQPVPVLHHPQREEVLPHVQTELPAPQFVPIAPCPVTGHHCKELLISSRGPFLPALSSRSRATESPLRSVLCGTLQGVAVWVDSSHACCSCVPSSELLLILCFFSVGEQCYVFHINVNFQM